METVIQIIEAAVGIVAVCVTIWLSVKSRNESDRKDLGSTLGDICERLSSVEAILKGVPELWIKVNRHGEAIAFLKARVRGGRDYDNDEEGSR